MKNNNSNQYLKETERMKTSGSRESRSEINKMNKLEENLRHFCGTENYFRHPINGLLFTDGIKYLAEKAEAYWLIDTIAAYQTKNLQEKYPFQIWTITVNKNKSAVLSMREDLNSLRKIKQDIEFTDFPLDYIKLYLIDNVLLLPGEY